MSEVYERPSYETDRWCELAPSQADFFKAQVNAIGSTVLSDVTREAGIRPFAASLFTAGVGGQQRPAFTWPDPTTPNASCYYIGKMGDALIGRSPQAFVRVSTVSNGYEIEGVGLNLTHVTQGSHLYGLQVMPDHGAEMPAHVVAGLEFMETAFRKARSFPEWAPPRDAPSALGIPGQVSAGLFNSIRSMHSNLAVVESPVGEQGIFTSHTYDMAQGLLKKAVNKVVKSKTAENETSKVRKDDELQATLLRDRNGRVMGSVVDSEKYGFTAITRLEDYPNTIAVATIERPPTSSQDSLLGIYTIQGRGVHFNIMQLPANQRTPEGIQRALGLAHELRCKENLYSEPIDDSTRQQLEKRMVGLLSELYNPVRK